MDLLATESGVTIGRFAHLAAPHGILGRTGGVSDDPYRSLNLGPRSGDDIACVAENRRLALTALGMDGRAVIAPRQIHSAGVSAYRRGEALPVNGVFDGDGLVTDDPDVTLMVLAADCAAVLLHDPTRTVVAALHAGWRGTAGNVAAAGVRAMAETFGCDPAGILAGVGPAIGPCCYEVGLDVAEQVAAAVPGDRPVYEPRGAGKAHLDLTVAIVEQLAAAGLRHQNIATADVCTACRTDLFFSHRCEGEPTGRFGAAIGIT